MTVLLKPKKKTKQKTRSWCRLKRLRDDLVPKVSCLESLLAIKMKMEIKIFQTVT